MINNGEECREKSKLFWGTRMPAYNELSIVTECSPTRIHANQEYLPSNLSVHNKRFNSIASP